MECSEWAGRTEGNEGFLDRARRLIRATSRGELGEWRMGNGNEIIAKADTKADDGQAVGESYLGTCCSVYGWTLCRTVQHCALQTACC